MRIEKSKRVGWWCIGMTWLLHLFLSATVIVWGLAFAIAKGRIPPLGVCGRGLPTGEWGCELTYWGMRWASLEMTVSVEAVIIHHLTWCDACFILPCVTYNYFLCYCRYTLQWNSHGNHVWLWIGPVLELTGMRWNWYGSTGQTRISTG